MITDFGEELKILRIKKGMSMRELARKSRVSPASVSRIEATTNTSILTASRLINALGYELRICEIEHVD